MSWILKKQKVLILITMLFPACVTGQDSTAEDPLISLGIRLHRSFIIHHTEKLKDGITSAKPWIAEAELAWHLRKRTTWAYCYCYPRAGFSLRYVNFDMPGILGSAVAPYAFIEPFIRPENRLNLSIRFGMGPAYLTKIYDDQRNPDNLFFGSHISFLVLLNMSLNYQIDPRLTLRLATDYNHISNGGFAEPNLGMNFPSVALGMDFSFHPPTFVDRDKDEVPGIRRKKNRFDLSYGISFKPPSYSIREGLYPVHCFGVNYSRTVGRIFALSAGAEWINNHSLKALVRIRNIRDEKGGYPDHNRIAPLVGIEWLFGRFVFSQQLGYYLYSPVAPSRQIYQRYGLLFRITDHILGGINIKAHGQDADFIDARIGFSL